MTTHVLCEKREMAGPVLLLAPTGFVVRTLLLQGLAANIAKVHKVVAAVPDPNDPLLQKILDVKNMTLIRHPRKFSSLGRIDGLHVRLWQQSYMSFSGRASIEFMQSYHKKKIRQSILVACMSAMALGSKRATRWIEKIYLRRLRRSENYAIWRTILEEVKPSMIISGMLSWGGPNAHSEDLACVVAAGDMGIPCTTVIQSWDNPYLKASIFPDHLIRIWTWSDAMTDLMKYRQPNLDATVYQSVGALQMEFHGDRRLHGMREEALYELKLRDNDRYIVYGGTTEVGFPQEPQLFFHVFTIMRRILPLHRMVLRLHPKDQMTRWMPMLEQLRDDRIVVQRPGPEKHMDEGGLQDPFVFYGNQLRTLAHADAVVSSFTTLLVDAAVINKPAVCVTAITDVDEDRLNEELHALSCLPHIVPLLATKGVKVCRSLDEIALALKAYVEDPALDSDKRASLACLMHKPDSSPSRTIADDVLLILANAEIRFNARTPLCSQTALPLLG